MQHMSKLRHELALVIDKMKYRMDINLFQGLEKWIIHPSFGACIRQTPTAASFDLNVFVLSRGNSLINLRKPRLQQAAEISEMYLCLLHKNWQPHLVNQLVLLMPLVITQ